MSNMIKLIITLIVCVTTSLIIIFNDVIYSVVLLSIIFIKGFLFKFLFVLKKFFFKKGIVSFATIAWERVFVSSFFALSKRAIINNVSGFFQKRIVKPLIHPLSRYLRVRWRMFKASNLWQKFLTILFGTIPASAALWLIGIADAIGLLMKGFSLAKFLTVILKFITVFFVFFQNIWRNWIQPYIDYIVITIFVSYIEKVPFIGKLFRKTRISIKWQLRGFKSRKKQIIKNHIDRPVTLLSERIHKHVNQKKEDLEPKDAVTKDEVTKNNDNVDEK